MAEKFSVTALVLAGGQGQRMGGVDKGWQIYDGQPLVKRMMDLVSPVTCCRFISANRNLSRYQTLAGGVVIDKAPWQGIGPLGGIFAVLDRLESSHLLVLPCDTPLFSEAALLHLLSAAEQTPNLVHFIATESGPHPLHAVIPVSALKQALPIFLEQTDHFGVMGFYKAIGVRAVNWDKETELVNINYIDQLVP